MKHLGTAFYRIHLICFRLFGLDCGQIKILFRGHFRPVPTLERVTDLQCLCLSLLKPLKINSKVALFQKKRFSKLRHQDSLAGVRPCLKSYKNGRKKNLCCRRWVLLMLFLEGQQCSVVLGLFFPYLFVFLLLLMYVGRQVGVCALVQVCGCLVCECVQSALLCV